MTDLPRRSVRKELGLDEPALQAPGFVVRLPAPARLVLLTGGPALDPNEARDGAPLLLWQAPGRCLAVGDGALPAALLATDVTDGMAVLALEGAAIADVLAMGCTLDTAALAPGTCARTLFAGIPATVHALPESVRLYVERTWAAYLVAWLGRAAAALGGAAGAAD